MIFLLATNNPNKAREIRPMFEEAGLTLITLADLGVHFEAGEDGDTFIHNATQKATETAAFLNSGVELKPFSKGAKPEPTSKPPSLEGGAAEGGGGCRLRETSDSTPGPSGHPLLKKGAKGPALDVLCVCDVKPGEEALLSTVSKPTACRGCGWDKPLSVLSKPENISLGNIAVLADDSGLAIDALGGEPGVDSALYLGRDTPYDIKCQSLIKRLAATPEENRTARFICVLVCVMPNGTKLVTEGTIEGRIAHTQCGENGFGYDPIFYYPPYGKTMAELTQEEKSQISHRGQAIQKMIGLIVNEGTGSQ